MLNLLLFFFISVFSLYILLWLGYTCEEHAYRDSHSEAANPPVGVGYNTKTGKITATQDDKKKSFWGKGENKAPTLRWQERPHPPAPCLFGRTEKGEFSEEGPQEPEFLTSNEANFWHHENGHSAQFCIETMTKMSERRGMRPK